MYLDSLQSKRTQDLLSADLPPLAVWGSTQSAIAATDQRGRSRTQLRAIAVVPYVTASPPNQLRPQATQTVALADAKLEADSQGVGVIFLRDAEAQRAKRLSFGTFPGPAHAQRWMDRGTAKAVIANMLGTGATRSARSLLSMALDFWPNDASLSAMARLLSRTGRVSRLPSQQSRESDFAWMARNRDQYRGRWVALSNGELLAAASTLQELLATLGDLSRSNPLIHRMV